jgi:hypothetical protein
MEESAPGTALPRALGCVAVCHIFWGVLFAISFGGILWNAVRGRFLEGGWIALLGTALFGAAAGCALLVGRWLHVRQPEAWRRAFIACRVLLYVYLLMAFCSWYAYERTGSLGASAGLLMHLGLALFSAISIGYLLRPTVREAFGVLPVPRSPRRRR